MFQGRIETMPIPERVYELCRIIADTPAPLKDIREKTEPSQINVSSTAYFGSILTAAKELNLVDDSNDQALTYIGDRQLLRDIRTFRRYCNSVVYQDTQTLFYQIAQCFLDSDLKWMQYGSLTSENVMNDIRHNTNIQTVYQDQLRGMRFWISFLGFGAIHEKGTSMVFLPNMYTALKDFLVMTKPELKQEYTVSEFCDLLMPYAHVALHNAKESHRFNYAMSAALRMMHDNKEIQMKRIPDSREIWNLYKQDDHVLISEISHIIVLKEVR